MFSTCQKKIFFTDISVWAGSDAPPSTHTLCKARTNLVWAIAAGARAGDSPLPASSLTSTAKLGKIRLPAQQAYESEKSILILHEVKIWGKGEVLKRGHSPSRKCFLPPPHPVARYTTTQGLEQKNRALEHFFSHAGVYCFKRGTGRKTRGHPLSLQLLSLSRKATTKTVIRHTFPSSSRRRVKIEPFLV